MVEKKCTGANAITVGDMPGCVVALKVHAAHIADRDGAALVLTGGAKQVPRIAKVWTASGYHGRFRPGAAAHLPGNGEIG